MRVVGAEEVGSSQDGRQEVVAVLQRKPGGSGRSLLRAVPEQAGKSILSVSLFRGRGLLKLEFHKELVRNFMEPCVCVLESIREVGAPPCGMDPVGGATGGGCAQLLLAL